MESRDLPWRDDGPEVVNVTTMHFGRLREPIFPAHETPEGHNSRLSYLLGVYASNGKKTTISLANSDHKAELVTALLKEVGCPYVSWTFDAGYIPNLNKIRFRPNWDLAMILGLPVPPEDD